MHLKFPANLLLHEAEMYSIKMHISKKGRE